MSGKLYFGGVPTRMDVDTLTAAFDPKAGQAVALHDIADAIHADPKSNRLRTVVNAWRKRMFRERNLQAMVEGGQLHFLTADGASDQNVKSFHRIGRATGRLRVRQQMVDTAQLSPEKRDRHYLLTRATEAIAAAARDGAKTMALPSPVKGKP